MFLSKHSYVLTVLLLALHAVTATAQGQGASNSTHDRALFPCMENGLKTHNVGCQLLAKMQVSRFPEGPLFWHINKFPTRASAEAARGQAGLVVEAEGRFWVFSFGPERAAPQRGDLVASIGPLQLTSDKRGGLPRGDAARHLLQNSHAPGAGGVVHP
jgi:hypothetical protein